MKPSQSVEYEAMLQLYVELKQSTARDYAFAAMRDMADPIYRGMAIANARDLRDAINTFLSDMGAPLTVSRELEAAE